MPDGAKPADEPARPSPANVAATLLLWAAVVAAVLVALCYGVGAALLPAMYN